MTKEIILLPHQKQALTSNKKKVIMRCGLGSGKSFLGAVWTLKKYTESPHSMGLITANSYSQLQNATLQSCFNLYDQYGINYKYNKQSHVLTVNGVKKFYCLSLDNYEIHRGIEVGEFWGDEIAYSKLEAYLVIMGRLRDKRGKLDTLLTTTPKGMNWVYDYYDPAGEKFDAENTEVIIAGTSSNTYLPEDYERSLRLEYGETLSKQELDAEFVRLGSGLAYYAFTDINIAQVDIKPEHTVLIGLDFNVNPYCAVLAQFIDNIIYVFDEIFLENSNTPEMIKNIKARIGTRAAKIFPDSTQFKRTTLGITDFDMLRREFEIVQTHNPFVIDRVNNMNRLFEQKRIVVSPRCKKLINDLNKVTWKDQTLTLDQVTDKKLTHMSDGAGYLAWKLLPFKKPVDLTVDYY